MGVAVPYAKEKIIEYLFSKNNCAFDKAKKGGVELGKAIINPF